MIEYGLIPQETIDSIGRYVKYGIPTGGFLQKVLENDLFEAVGRADAYNSAVLPSICAYIYNKIPSRCWGSKEKVAAWLESMRQKRILDSEPERQAEQNLEYTNGN